MDLSLDSVWNQLPYAGQGPVARGVIRSQAADFRVCEIPVTEPAGEGEHCWLYIRKTQANTEWVARLLARHAGVKPFAVSYAGLKDRNAVTEQWFSVHLPGRQAPDWSSLDEAGVEILRAERHTRKLKRGALRANRFTLRIRDLIAEPGAVEQCLLTIQRDGVPNYFGSQRFGREGSNLRAAGTLFNGGLGRITRHKRGLYLSAARAALFNRVLATRLAAGYWYRILPGDVLQLDGRRACFIADNNDTSLELRLQQQAVHQTGPLWGCGELMTQAYAREYEQTALEPYARYRHGLEQAGLEQARRSLRIRVQDLAWSWEQENQLLLNFTLPAGAYATCLLRELCLT